MSEYTLDVLIEGYDKDKAQVALEQTGEMNKDWRDVFESRQNQTILQAEIQGVEDKIYSVSPKKEMLCAIVEIGTVRGLIPLEFLGVEKREEARRLIGEKVAFMVVAVDRENDFFVGSRKQALDQMASRTLKRIEKGDDVLGVVREVYNSNMMMDIGGIRTMVPASQASHGWVDSMHDLYKVGDHVKVRIIDVDKKKKEVSVSIKATQPNPWERVQDHFQENGEYVGRVSGVSEFGTYVTLRDGISGLASHLRHEVVKKGDKVLVRIVKVRQKEQKMNIKVIKVF